MTAIIFSCVTRSIAIDDKKKQLIASPYRSVLLQSEIIRTRCQRGNRTDADFLVFIGTFFFSVTCSIKDETRLQFFFSFSVKDKPIRSITETVRAII